MAPRFILHHKRPLGTRSAVASQGSRPVEPSWGGVEQDETPWDAAIREVREETGLEVTVEKLVGIYSKPRRNLVTLCFECIVSGGSLKVSDEADEHRYFAVENLPRRLSPNQREYIRDWASETTPTMRHQEGPPAREWLKTLG